MTLSAEALQKKAKKRELKELEMNKVNPERMASLEGILYDVYVIFRPTQSDYHNRRDLVRVFNEISKEIYGKSNDHPVVVEFGSFTMDNFSPKSDLDLSINFSADTVMAPREMKIKTLRKFAKKFYALLGKGHVSSVHPIMTANVPIIKVIDSGTGIECDLSVENRDGILKSQIVHMISSIDERFQKLSFLMKGWAKANHINSSKDHTLNSLSIVLLVAFHLQTRDPPILPPFSLILKDGSDRVTVSNVIKQYVGYGKNNTESLADLFVTLLIKLSSVEKLWSRGLCASTYQGCWISKTWNNSKVGCISVEDFTDRSQNVAKAVTKDQVKRIYGCVKKSIQFVATFMEGHLQGPRLRSYLFGGDYYCAAASITTVISPKYQDHHQNISKKRMRITQEEEQQGWRSWGGDAGTWTTAGPPVSTAHHHSWRGPPAPALAVNAWGVPIQAAGGGGDGWGGRATGSWGGWGGGTATPSSSSSLLRWVAPPPTPPQQWSNNTSNLGWFDNNSNPLPRSFPYHHHHHR